MMVPCALRTVFKTLGSDAYIFSIDLYTTPCSEPCPFVIQL